MVKKYTKEEPLKVFTAFSGYDSQCLALKRLGIQFDLVGWSEIDKAAIQAHDALFPEYKDRNYGDISKIDWSQVPDFDFFTYSSPCFVRGTRVITFINGERSSKEIQDIEIGDYVLTHTNKYKKVTEIYESEYNNSLIQIELLGDSGTVICTLNHPFYVNRNGEYQWIQAAELNIETDWVANFSGILRFSSLIIDNELCEKKIGEHICTKIKNISRIDNDSCLVYNLEVEDDHSYTANGIFVHNCTDFSNAGLQAGGEEGSGTRSSLLWECRKTILAKKPKYLMFENVKALVTDKFKYLFEKWCKELESYGYANFYQVLNAKDYGVPQSRERIFMISILKTEDDPDPYYEFPKPIKLEKTVEDILEDDVPDKYYQKQEVVDHYMEIMGQEYPKDEWNAESDGETFEGLW